MGYVMSKKEIKRRHYLRRFRLSFLEAGIIALAICALLFPSYEKLEKNDENYFNITINGTEIGNVASREKAEMLMTKARIKVAKEQKNEDLVLMDIDVDIKGSSVLFGKVINDNDAINKIVEVMKANTVDKLKKAYTVKINETSVNLSSYEEVNELLEQSIAPYDTNDAFDVELCLDNEREVNVFEAKIISKEEKKQQEEKYRVQSAGFEKDINEMFLQVEPVSDKSFEDYELGLMDIKYGDKIEVVETYLMEDNLTPLQEAVDRVTKEQETQVIYKVVKGDTLSQICIDNNIPMEELIAINDALEDENTMIRIDQELVITVPEPDLSVIWRTQDVYNEDYEAEVQYIPNDNWYTNQTVTIQEPSAGRRRVAAIIEYKNGEKTGVEIVKEEIYAEAVPKIVERGTKTPPTYIRPISGGRQSSGFGARSAPTKGASTYHKGIDWAVPIGTKVVASNAGTVVQAGWSSGYGYAVFINHEDGRQTRYGHLSKVLVSPGQKVSQGQKIALSGNTGRSTGPHLHFEIRIGGTAVNPLKYLN